MSEKDIRNISIIKALCPPFIYSFIMMTVQVVMDLVIFIRHTKSITKKGTAGFAESYSFMDTIENNLDKYSYIITFISAIIALAVFGIWYYKLSEEYEKKGFIRQFNKSRLKKIWLAALLGLFGGVGLSRFVSLLPLDNIIGNYEDTRNALMGGSLFIQILSLAIVVPISEELIYRGLVFTGLTKVIDAKYAVFITSVVFGVFHLNLLQGTYAFIFSLILICVYMKYRSIIAPVIVHIAANFTAVISSYFGISQFLNKNLIIYIIIMVIELAAGLLLFIIMFGDEENSRKKKM